MTEFESSTITGPVKAPPKKGNDRDPLHLVVHLDLLLNDNVLLLPAREGGDGHLLRHPNRANEFLSH